MQAVSFARLRRANKRMFEYVESNARQIGVMAYSFLFPQLKEDDIHSGYTFYKIYYDCLKQKNFRREEFFATRKCRTIHLAVSPHINKEYHRRF